MKNKQQRKSKPENISLYMRKLNRYAILLTLLVMIITGIFVVKNIYNIYQIQKLQTEVELQKEELKSANEKLIEEKNNLNDPKYIGEIAKKELGVVKKDEIPYIR